MKQLGINHLTNLLRPDHEPPCISLYQPTHRHHPENQQDPIRYRNLLVELAKSLHQKYSKRAVQKLLERFYAIACDGDFWNHRTDGMAILSSPDVFQIFELQRTVPELLIVADSFHTKPLFRILQSADRYQILAINRYEAKLYEGSRYVLDPIELSNVPATITEALGEKLTEQHMTVASYGAGAGRAFGGGVAPSIHAHGDKKDEVDIDRDRFFRSIDRGVLEHHSRPSGLPLLLASLSEHSAPFRALSHNPFLMKDGIMINPDALNLEQLRNEAWRIVEPNYLQRLTKLTENYQELRSRQLGSDDLAQVAMAVTSGRVQTLLVEDARQLPGTIYQESGQIRWGDISDPEVDDVLDDLAEMVVRMKGSVVVLPSEQMPSTTGVAAMYRF